MHKQYKYEITHALVNPELTTVQTLRTRGRGSEAGRGSKCDRVSERIPNTQSDSNTNADTSTEAKHTKQECCVL